MFFKSVELKNYRNYDLLKLKFTPTINIIVGKNGQGKTNILESLYYTGHLKSHRVSDDTILIKNNKKNFKIFSKIQKNEFLDEIKIENTEYSRKIYLNNDEITKKSEYLELINIILFEPSNLELIKGSPNIRREFLNDAIININHSYYNILNDYNKLLKMRNEYLKFRRNDKEYLEVLDKYFIDKAMLIYQMRNKYINKINEFITNIFRDIMNIDNLKIQYKSFYNILLEQENPKEYFQNFLKENYEKEKNIGLTSEGPHKDDFVFLTNQINLKEYGSQGQQRAGVISLKFAEAEIIKKYKKTLPVLLLDDVFSELDGIRKNNLLKYLSSGSQVILTTTDINKISKKLIDNANIIKIEQYK
ncbi:MAG: DNA replication/repair protein RecF [Erysipelotrichaceae bacterium]|nr:DNA replication/repair protein RecF [Erysipelotrichaceae bacterium]